MIKARKRTLKKIEIPSIGDDEGDKVCAPDAIAQKVPDTPICDEPVAEPVAEPKILCDDVLRKEPLPENGGGAKEEKYFFGFGDGEQTLIADKVGALEINDVGAPDFSLADWNLIINDLDVIPLEGRVGEDVYLPLEMSRGILSGPDGYRVDFCNIAKITVLPEGEITPKRKDSDHLFLAGASDNAKGWVVAVESSKVINLAEVAGAVIPVNPDAYGILTGPAGSLLSFSQINKIIVP